MRAYRDASSVQIFVPGFRESSEILERDARFVVHQDAFPNELQEQRLREIANDRDGRACCIGDVVRGALT